jgi:hypothetical protein
MNSGSWCFPFKRPKKDALMPFPDHVTGAGAGSTYSHSCPMGHAVRYARAYARESQTTCIAWVFVQKLTEKDQSMKCIPLATIRIRFPTGERVMLQPRSVSTLRALEQTLAGNRELFSAIGTVRRDVDTYAVIKIHAEALAKAKVQAIARKGCRGILADHLPSILT